MPNLLYVAAAVLLGLELPQTSPPVQVESFGNAEYRLIVTAEGTQDPAAAHALLRPTADGLCGDLPAQYGRYRFNAEGPAPGQPGPARGSVALIQDLTCGEPLPAAAEPVPIALTQAEIDALAPVILDFTNQYFTAVEQARDTDAFALTTPEITGGGTAEDWIDSAGERRDLVGAPVSRQIARLTWYPNPPHSPRPGLYVAVDYVAGWTLQDECGYLIWFRPDPDTPFRLTRQEQTFLPHELDDATRSALRTRHCILLQGNRVHRPEPIPLTAVYRADLAAMRARQSLLRPGPADAPPMQAGPHLLQQRPAPLADSRRAARCCADGRIARPPAQPPRHRNPHRRGR